MQSKSKRVWGAAAPQPGGSGGRESPQDTGSVLSAETLPQEHRPSNRLRNAGTRLETQENRLEIPKPFRGPLSPRIPMKNQYFLRPFLQIFIFVFLNFRLSVVIGALPAPSLHQNELNASTAYTFSKHVILMIFVKTQPYVVIGAPLPIS